MVMSIKHTIDMAREAGFDTHTSEVAMNVFFTEELKAFEALVRADEREACAKVADRYVMCDPIAKAIRARGNT
jgi:hypothetical protein